MSAPVKVYSNSSGGAQTIVIFAEDEKLILGRPVAIDFGSVEEARKYGALLLALPDDALGVALFGAQAGDDEKLLGAVDLVRQLARKQNEEGSE